MNGLDILTYLGANGVPVNEDLCKGVPDSVIQELGISKVVYIVNTLVDDTLGEKANRFPDYWNRVPERTQPEHVEQLKEAFERFVQQVLLGNKDMHKTAEEHEDAEDLAEDIRGLIQDLQQSWSHWSENYEALFEQMRELLPLLEEQYDNPILESIALLMEEDMVHDTIPDEYIETILNAILAMGQIYNSKVEKLHITPVLSSESLRLFEKILSISIYLYHYLDWGAFDIQLRNGANTINNISVELIQSINNIFYRVKEGIIKIAETPEV